MFPFVNPGILRLITKQKQYLILAIKKNNAENRNDYPHYKLHKYTYNQSSLPPLPKL